jgi:hypothetical protein
MQGLTGHRLAHKGTAGHLTAADNLVPFPVPAKTTVESQQLIDGLGRPTYRRDIKV